MHVSAKGDYAVRAVVGLSVAHPARVSSQQLAEQYDMPRKFMEAVMGDLRRAGIVASNRGPDGGYSLRKPPSDIAVGDVLRVIDGPLADVHGLRPDEVEYSENLKHLQELWVAARSAVRSVFDAVTFEQLCAGDFPPEIRALFDTDDAWAPRFGRGPVEPPART